MAGLTALFADYVIHIDEKGKVVVEKGGQVCGNTKAALRDIATSAGFTIEPKWNTQSCGKKLAVFLNSSQTPVPKEPETKAPETKAPEEKREDSEFELTPEEMERILKRFEELENRLNKLSATISAQPSGAVKDLEARLARIEALITSGGASNNIPNQKETIKEELNISLTSYHRDPDGSITKYWKSAKKVNYDTRYDSLYATFFLTTSGRVLSKSIYSFYSNSGSKSFDALMEMADEVGHKFTFDVPETMPEDSESHESLLKKMNDELVRKFGKGGVAIFSDYYLEANGREICSFDTSSKMDRTIRYLSNPVIICREWSNEPFEDNSNWTNEEQFRAIKNYVNSLKKKYN